jgi:hypothetical protein
MMMSFAVPVAIPVAVMPVPSVSLGLDPTVNLRSKVFQASGLDPGHQTSLLLCEGKDLIEVPCRQSLSWIA